LEKIVENRAKTRAKTRVQEQKERDRRRRIREMLETAIGRNEAVTQVQIAKTFEVSQATVSRDLKTLGKSRWNPWRLLELKTEREIQALRRRRAEDVQDFVDGLSWREAYAMIGGFMRKKLGGHYYPSHSKPRGKPFSSTYQP
jgi:Mn-dependent DtxR family transcriptional regulator